MGVPFNNSCFFAFPSVGFSQTISFSGKDVHLTKIFSAIKSQTGYVFSMTQHCCGKPNRYHRSEKCITWRIGHPNCNAFNSENLIWKSRVPDNGNKKIRV